MAIDMRRKYRALAIIGFMRQQALLKAVGAHAEEDAPSDGGDEPSALTMDRTDITMDRSDITFDMTEV